MNTALTMITKHVNKVGFGGKTFKVYLACNQHC